MASVEIVTWQSGPNGQAVVLRHLGAHGRPGRVHWSVVGDLSTTRSGFTTRRAAMRYLAQVIGGGA